MGDNNPTMHHMLSKKPLTKRNVLHLLSDWSKGRINITQITWCWDLITDDISYWLPRTLNGISSTQLEASVMTD